MHYDVMIQCPRGTWQMMHAIAGGMEWRTEAQTITWCHCDTLAEADAIGSALLSGARPGTMRVWIKHVEPRLRMAP